MVPVRPGFAAHARSGGCLQGGMAASYDPPSSGIGLRAAESSRHQSPSPFVSHSESTITPERNQQHTFSHRSTPELGADNILKLGQAYLLKACVRVGVSSSWSKDTLASRLRYHNITTREQALRHVAEQTSLTERGAPTSLQHLRVSESLTGRWENHSG
jgi:hypothetical protein